MRKIETPLEPQTFRSGVATIYRVTNTANPGDLPAYSPSQLYRLPFEARKLSDVRYYAAMQADSKISRVIRIPWVRGIQPSGDICILNDKAKKQYKITRVSENPNTNPESLDLTLEISKTTYEVTSSDN